jgi:hypothetical protein
MHDAVNSAQVAEVTGACGALSATGQELLATCNAKTSTMDSESPTLECTSILDADIPDKDRRRSTLESHGPNKNVSLCGDLLNRSSVSDPRRDNAELTCFHSKVEARGRLLDRPRLLRPRRGHQGALRLRTLGEAPVGFSEETA